MCLTWIMGTHAPGSVMAGNGVRASQGLKSQLAITPSVAASLALVLKLDGVARQGGIVELSTVIKNKQISLNTEQPSQPDSNRFTALDSSSKTQVWPLGRRPFPPAFSHQHRLQSSLRHCHSRLPFSGVFWAQPVATLLSSGTAGDAPQNRPAALHGRTQRHVRV